MADFDQFKLSVEALSGGSNTVLLDDRGMPSVMVNFPKLLISDVIDGASDNIHPAFSVNSAEKSSIYVSKFQNIVLNDRAYSLPLKNPRTSVTFDEANTYCRNKGDGWALMPYSLWCAIALWCRKNGTMPRGNNYWGADHSYTHEKGVAATTETSSDYSAHIGETAHIYTGSGPDTWNHNWLPDGICDLNGNVYDRCAGMRLYNGEIQIIPYANCFDSEVSMDESSTYWKAISSDGSLVDAGSDGTLKWDYVSSKLILTNEDVTYETGGSVGCTYQSMSILDGLEAPELAKALLLYPDEPGGDYGSDYHWANLTGERMPICGGYWRNGSNAGVFNVNL
ncbi:MAG: hypothetical protein LUG99_00550, partial [Lachnospiraceae bacterium]|nr:hypothetical protein [Lachnospiraceae bacterium]